VSVEKPFAAARHRGVRPAEVTYRWQGSGEGGGAIVAGSQCSSALPSTKRQVSNHVVE
jgi:hypothetical protein